MYVGEDVWIDPVGFFTIEAVDESGCKVFRERTVVEGLEGFGYDLIVSIGHVNVRSKLGVTKRSNTSTISYV